MKEFEREAPYQRQGSPDRLYNETFRRYADCSSERLKNLSKFNVADSRQESGMKPMGTQSVRLVVPAERGHQGALWILSKLERHSPPRKPALQLSISVGPRELFVLGFAILWRGYLSSVEQAKVRLDILLRRK